MWEEFRVYSSSAAILLISLSTTQRRQTRKRESRLLFLAHLTSSFIIKCQLPGMVFSFTFPSWQTCQPLLAQSDFCCASSLITLLFNTRIRSRDIMLRQDTYDQTHAGCVSQTCKRSLVSLSKQMNRGRASPLRHPP